MPDYLLRMTRSSILPPPHDIAGNGEASSIFSADDDKEALEWAKTSEANIGGRSFVKLQIIDLHRINLESKLI